MQVYRRRVWGLVRRNGSKQAKEKRARDRRLLESISTTREIIEELKYACSLIPEGNAGRLILIKEIEKYEAFLEEFRKTLAE